MNRIVILDGYALNPGDLSWEGIESLGDVTIYDRTPENLILERIGDADIVLTNKITLDKEILSKCSNVKYIGVFATGYNIIDVKYCKENDIVVTNIPTYGTEEVAQHAFALILELTNHVNEHSEKVKEGKWAKSKDFCFWDKPLMSLNNKTLGIIGVGKIGMKTAEIAQAFGMNIIAATSKERVEKISDKFSYDTLDKLLRNSDVISLNCPLTDKTYEIINKHTLSKMKQGVILINTSRGQLINEKDLLNALETGHVRSCGLDVLETEPPKDNILIGAPNVIVTPHIAWAALEARTKLMNIAIDNLNSYINGENKNCVY